VSLHVEYKEEAMSSSAHSATSETSSAPVTIRRATAADAEACGRICYEAFREIAIKHGFVPDIPTPDVGIRFISGIFSHPRFFCVVAEQNGKIVGSNCLDERGAIAGIGPITVSVSGQNNSVGRQLMKAVLSRAEERNFAGIRLVQAGYHTRSLSLYSKLGFVVREPLACMHGEPVRAVVSGYHVRPAQIVDLDACNALCNRVHGHDRAEELRDGVQEGTAVVAESRGRITAYASSLALFGHAVAESNDDLQAIISAANDLPRPGFLVPMRNAALFQWCLAKGLRTIEPMNLMTVGLYNEPAGAYLPSILF
jgi:predicted N-acetyltransferase YhbS